MKISKIIALTFTTAVLMACSNEATTGNDTKTTSENTPQQKSESFTVSPSIFKEKMEAENGTILDVRTPEEVAEGIIPNAVTININDADFETQLNKLDKSKPVYVYCKAGGRSSRATDMMMKNGFTLVYNLDGGIDAWVEEGFNIIKK